MAGSAFNRAIHNCGVECALRRFNRKCTKQFGSMSCLPCKWNIETYVNADPRHVRLFMLQCEQDASELKHRAQPPWLVIFFALGFIGLLAFGHYKANQKYKQFNKENPPTRTVNQAQPEDEVWATMRKVTYDIVTKKVDVNGDGLQNCIDASVLFYKYFPDKDRVCIEVNYNPNNGFNHAFNCVKMNGVWRAIEPQTHWKGRSSYWMLDSWQGKYDVFYNEDQTAKWKVYAK